MQGEKSTFTFIDMKEHSVPSLKYQCARLLGTQFGGGDKMENILPPSLCDYINWCVIFTHLTGKEITLLNDRESLKNNFLPSKLAVHILNDIVSESSLIVFSITCKTDSLFDSYV